MEQSLSPSDTQVAGTHYRRGNIQVWDVALDWGLDPWAHNVVKYTMRFKHKNGLEDLQKARHYLDFMIANYDLLIEKYPK